MKFKRIETFNILILIMMITFITNIKIANAKERHIMKVAYPIKYGITEEEHEAYKGYVYEYLREIAKYTGWEYEFVEIDFNDLKNSLEDGKIDIVAGIVKHEDFVETCDFTDYNIGETYTTLSILDENTDISKSDYETLEGKKIGYMEIYTERLNKFIEFCKGHDIQNIELVPYSEEEAQYLVEKLKSKEIDAIIEGDLLINSEKKVVAKFGPRPYYLVTSKKNKEIMTQLNSTIYKIRENNSEFSQNLYDKYFPNNNDHSISLTEEEREYIKNTNKLKAVYIEDYEPIQYYDSETNKPKGIFIDYINLIFKKIGINIEFIKVKTYEEAYKMIHEKKADLIVGIPSEYLVIDKNEVTSTVPYFKLNMVKVISKSEKNETNKQKVAISIGHGYSNIGSNEELVIYNTIEDCINALDEGKVDLIYGNEYTMAHYMSGGYYPNLVFMSNNTSVPTSVGLSKDVDINLLNIINKAIYSISKDESRDIAYRNTISLNYEPTIKQFFYGNLIFCITIIILVLSIIGIMIFIIVKMRFDKIKEAKENLFRKTQIDTLTGVYNRDACEQLITKYLDIKDLSLYSAFIIIDIDNFKGVNDYLGHKIGDKVLINFANILEGIFQNNDIVSRLGGDEFIVLMKDIEEKDLENINQKLQKLCTVMNIEVEYNGNSQNISLSIGAIATKNNLKFEELYQMADEMLYKVKHDGKNGFKVKVYNRLVT